MTAGAPNLFVYRSSVTQHGFPRLSERPGVGPESDVFHPAVHARQPEPPADHAPRLGRYQRDAKEHEARGLLNLIVLLSRCLEGDDVSPSDQREWRGEVERANDRLEELYRDGLPRTFLSGSPR